MLLWKLLKCCWYWLFICFWSTTPAGPLVLYCWVLLWASPLLYCYPYYELLSWWVYVYCFLLASPRFSKRLPSICVLAWGCLWFCWCCCCWSELWSLCTEIDSSEQSFSLNLFRNSEPWLGNLLTPPPALLGLVCGRMKGVLCVGEANPAVIWIEFIFTPDATGAGPDPTGAGPDPTP